MLSYTIIEKRNVLSKKKKKRIILKASVGKPPLETVKIPLGSNFLYIRDKKIIPSILQLSSLFL